VLLPRGREAKVGREGMVGAGLADETIDWKRGGGGVLQERLQISLVDCDEQRERVPARGGGGEQEKV